MKMPEVGAERLDEALTNAVNPQKLIDNLAEAWRTSPEEARSILQGHGFDDLLTRLPPTMGEAGGRGLEPTPQNLGAVLKCAAGHIRIRAFNPPLSGPSGAPRSVEDAVSPRLNAFLPKASKDSLGVLYRHEPLTYARSWLADVAPRIDAFVRSRFGRSGPQYLVNSGIGANEQFNYLVSALANARPDAKVRWLLADSPKEVAALPADATEKNTLFMEFSRSGITEETIKLHELTPRTAARIVFSNAGPLRALAQRDDNLVLDLPDEVSGRYGRNRTPILMAPMYVAGLDVEGYWSAIDAACQAFCLSDAASLPVRLARYLRLQQLSRGVNHIYVGTNDSLLRCSADELCQFWNEGVNRDGNDITMSRYLGLPRDSHMNLEAILGTSDHKMAVFLVRTGEPGRHPLLSARTDPLDPAHAGLTAGDVDLILTLANVKRCSEKMPTILITVDEIDLTASAWLGQLWADLTLVYARLIGVDPGSNPEVKAVRSRASAWLADKASATALLADDDEGS
jgi:glucose-6-phosphate isomerase